MTIKRRKCRECGGNNPEECEQCWLYAMDRFEAERDRETDKRIDEARVK
jgi:hypothetical protein